MTAEPASNSFRRSVLSGEKRKLLVTDKAPKLARQDKASDALDDVVVPRAESRRGDHRDLDRHRLATETATVRYRGRKHEVELVNLSAGGAMIRCGFAPRLWDMVEIRFGEAPPIEAAVRWLRGDQVGLEFAHETRIDCEPEQRAAILLDVIRRSFPESRVELETVERPEAPADQPKQEDLGNRGETRHPLVWKGQIHFAFDSNPVRLRNISSGGALVDVATVYPVGAEVMLDLGDAGQMMATVTWASEEQAGLRFARPFDMACLANARPDLTPYRWQRPSFLDADGDEASAWDDKWTRSSIAELKSELEGFLKR